LVTTGRLIDTMIRTKDQKKTVSGKPQGRVRSRIDQMADRCACQTAGPKTARRRLRSTIPALRPVSKLQTPLSHQGPCDVESAIDACKIKMV
jgi:hypothetical protein